MYNGITAELGSAYDGEFVRKFVVSQWTEERIEKLKRLWPTGLSASQIAGEIGGVSRNAVIGKAHRMQLPPRKSANRYYDGNGRPRASKTKGRPTRSDGMPLAPKFAEIPLPEEPVRPAKLFKLVDLEDDQCRFIWGDPRTPDSGYCGCKKAPGSSYCAGHHARVYTAPRPLTDVRYYNDKHKRRQGRLPVAVFA